ncbi:RasGAP [Niveomyces insectorum RCEF 264]|uniref:5'-3' exoribonuclease n=1 Tax=Niveomyces insectorum RCEF 264 TaxID=1081102 RepID=A0A167SJ53_9HYPO|nr:RasGAP [Niveomyces insectorum RCEF 264]
MGIPAAFRWLSSKYPKIISPVIEETPQTMDDGTTIPVDTTGSNPNGEEFDNLYLDMNGIVHPCSHPEDRPPPKDEEEMMLEIFKYTDRVVNMVRPRKLLMIAVDGVAPRAKMNQQRSRRFRAVQEAKEKEEDKQELLKLLKQQNGGTLPSESLEAAAKKAFDSNSITPGTPFMDTLAASLRYWCAYKLNTDPAWAKMKIIISDASVPGEGEHKIMAYVRSQRASPNHDPNTRHVIYGLDADLIMLSLATHEPHFRVLREDVFFQDSKTRTCKLCGQKGHEASACRGEVKEKDGEFDEKDSPHPLKPFIWLHVSVLREYLAVELDVPSLPFRWDLERAIDDWIFLCCFVGNDFLPHLPALEIRENGINTLTALWKDNLPYMNGYVTKDGHVDLERAQYIMSGLAKQEDAIFRRRKQQEDRREENNKRRKLQEQQGRGGRNGGPNTGGKPTGGDNRFAETSAGLNLHPIASFPTSVSKTTITHDMVVNRNAVQHANVANKSAASVLKNQIQVLMSSQTSSETETGAPAKAETQDEAATTTTTTTTDAAAAAADTAPDSSPASALGKRKADLMEEEDNTSTADASSAAETPKATTTEEAPVDTVRLWEEGYADRYYEQKFHVDPKDIEFRHSVARSYVEGLAWVLLYYFQGCPSWEWFYPYHYAPFAADFVDLAKMELNFEKGRISRPFEQLMSVLPAGSRHAIPEVFHDLMTNEDSEIIDFYPETFDLDLNGKKFAWQGVALLPFIDMKRLLAAVEQKYPLLSPEDVIRNGVGKVVLMLSDADTALYDEITSNFYSKRQGATQYKLNPLTSGGIAGKIEKIEDYIPHGSLAYPLERKAFPDIEYDRSLSVHYKLPSTSHTHKSMLLRGAKLPAPVLDRNDKEALLSKMSRSGRSYGGAPLHNHNGNGNGNGNGNYNRPRYDGGGRNQPINYGPGGSYPRQDRSDRPPYYAQPGQNYRGSYQAPPPLPPPASQAWAPPPPGYPGFGAGRPPPPPPPVPAHYGGGRYNDGGGYGYNQGNQGRYEPPPPPGAYGQHSYGQQSYRPPPPGYGGQGHRQGDNRSSGGYHGSRNYRGA